MSVPYPGDYWLEAQRMREAVIRLDKLAEAIVAEKLTNDPIDVLRIIGLCSRLLKPDQLAYVKRRVKEELCQPTANPPLTTSNQSFPMIEKISLTITRSNPAQPPVGGSTSASKS